MRTPSIIWKGSGAIGLRNLIPLAAGLCVGTALTTQSLAKKGGNDPGESSVPSVVEAPVDYELTELHWPEDQNPDFQGLHVDCINSRGWAVGFVRRPAPDNETAIRHGVINIASDGSGDATNTMLDLNDLFENSLDTINEQRTDGPWRIAYARRINEAGLVVCELIPNGVPARGDSLPVKIPLLLAVAKFGLDGVPETLTLVDEENTTWAQRAWEINENGDILVMRSEYLNDGRTNRLYVNLAPSGDAPNYGGVAIPGEVRFQSLNSGLEIVTERDYNQLLRLTYIGGDWSDELLWEANSKRGEGLRKPVIAEDGTVYVLFGTRKSVRPYRVTDTERVPLTDEDASTVNLDARSMSRASSGEEEVLLRISSTGQYQVYKPKFGARFVLPVAPGTIYAAIASPPIDAVGSPGYRGGHIAYVTDDAVQRSFILTPVAP